MRHSLFWWGLANSVRQFVGMKLLPKPCCRDPKNLGPVEAIRPDFTFRRCVVCHCRHFELTADPGVLGVVGRG